MLALAGGLACADSAGTVILVTHDRYFLDRATNRILEISRGKLYGYEANYSRFPGAESSEGGDGAGHVSGSARAFSGWNWNGQSQRLPGTDDKAAGSVWIVWRP